METQEELGARVQEEITAILINNDVKVSDIDEMIRDLPYKWTHIPDRSLSALRTELRKMTLKQYLANEDAIRSISLRANEELRLLIASTAAESDQA